MYNAQVPSPYFWIRYWILCHTVCVKLLITFVFMFVLSACSFSTILIVNDCLSAVLSPSFYGCMSNDVSNTPFHQVNVEQTSSKYEACVKHILHEANIEQTSSKHRAII